MTASIYFVNTKKVLFTKFETAENTINKNILPSYTEPLEKCFIKNIYFSAPFSYLYTQYNLTIYNHWEMCKNNVILVSNGTMLQTLNNLMIKNKLQNVCNMKHSNNRSYDMIIFRVIV